MRQPATAVTAAQDAAMMWLSPLPAAVAARIKPIPPGYNPAAIASHIVERAWRASGVRVYFWSCGTLAIVNIGSQSDALMLAECLDHLMATYARHSALLHGAPMQGPTFKHVLADLRDANRCAS